MLEEFIQNNAFLGWYLSPRSRINRVWFNVVFFVASMVGLVFYYYDYKDDIDALSNTFNQATSGGYYQQEDGDVEKAMRQQELMDKLRRVQNGDVTAAEDLMKMMESDEEGESSFRWSFLLNIILFLGIAPVVAMRFRDMGKKEETAIRLTVASYAPLILDLLNMIGLTFLSFLMIPSYIVTFVLLSWAAMAKSEEYVPPSQRVEFPKEPKEEIPDPVIPSDLKNVDHDR
jgi:uncharacterized membrane protein YhaH (DUF805 family)